jgi:hypothetical protein
MDSNTVENVKKLSSAKMNGDDLLFNYFLIPFRAGLYGFLIFFGILVITKLFGYMIGTQKIFLISSGDLLLSLIGFGPIFMIRLLVNFRKEQN